MVSWTYRLSAWGSFLLSCCFYSITAQTNDSLYFSIADSLLEQTIHPVVVTAQSTPTDLSASVLPVRIITKTMIAQRGAVQLTEILQQEPNIRIQRDPVLGTSITMNGLSGKHINILIDGVPMIGRSGGNIDLDRIPVQNIMRIEIIENALSVAYGTNALGGTINIITQQAALESSPHLEVTLMGQTQSNGQHDGSILLSWEHKGISLRAGYQYSQFQGWSTDTTRNLTWNAKQQHQPFARFYYQLPKTNIRIGYHFDYLQEAIQDQGILQIPRFPNLSYAKDYEFITKTQDHSVRVLGYLDQKKRYYLRGTVGYNQFEREKNAYFQPLAENPDPVRLDTLDSDTTSFGGIMARWQLASSYHKKFEFTAGLDLRYDYTTGERIENQYGVLGDYAFFGTLQYRPVRALTLHLGGRIAYNTLAPAPPFTYVLGLKWNPVNGMYIRASYTRGIRTPSLKELYLDFVDINHFIKGNPNLHPEYAHNLRLSWAYAVAKGSSIFNTQVSLFYNHINEQIQLFSFKEDSTGNRIPDPTSFRYTYFNLDEYQNWGVNARAKYQYKGLTIRLGANLTGHYNSENANHPELVDPFNYTVEWSQEITYTIPTIKTRLSLYRRDYDRILRYSLAEPPGGGDPVVVQYSLAGYSMMDMTLTQPLLQESILLSFGAKNLLGVQDLQQAGGTSGAHSSGSSSLNVAMGRIWWVRLIVHPHKLAQLKKTQGFF